MKRIKKLLIKNFQNHQYRIIEFEDVTCFIGTNDVGKSSTLRALRFICLNKPSGEGFINTKAEKLFMKLEVDGHVIKRKKGAGKNLYYLDGKKLKAFGAGKVPDSIAEILNVGEECFAKQHQKLFWFQDSPGQVSKELNRIVNLDVIDKILKNVSSDLRSRKSELNVTKTRLQKAKQQKKSLSWVVNLDKKVKLLEQKAAELDKLNSENKELDNLIKEYEVTHRTSVVAKFQINVMDSAIAAGKQLQKAEIECTELSKLINKCKKTQKITKKQIPDLSKLITVKEEVVQADKQCQNLRALIIEASLIKRKNRRLSIKIKKAQKKIQNIEARFKKCRLCGSMTPR